MKYYKFNISMPREFYIKVQQKADEKAMSVSGYIRYAIMELWGNEK